MTNRLQSMQESNDTHLHHANEEQVGNEAPKQEEITDEVTPQEEGNAQNQEEETQEKTDGLTEEYSAMDLNELVKALEKLLSTGKVHHARKSFDALIATFNKKYRTLIDSKNKPSLKVVDLRRTLKSSFPKNPSLNLL